VGWALFSVSVCLLQALASYAGTVPLRVLTYNIHHGEGRDQRIDLDRIAGVIRDTNANVVCLQEVDRNQPRSQQLDFPAELSKRLGMPVVFENNYAFGGGEYGNATLTRLEMVSHENIPLPNPNNAEPRGCLKTVVKTPAGNVQILNTHLGLNETERAQQVEALLKAVGQEPLILAGDFNEGIDQPGVAKIAADYQDALGKAGVPKTHGERARIDHIFVSSEFEVVFSRMVSTAVTKMASDHFPYMTEMFLRGKQTK